MTKPLNAELLRSTFQLVTEREPAITGRFYEILFERYPQVRPLFGGNSARAQQEMLQGALVAVIEHLEDTNWLASTLAALGRKHVAYGVTREMFDWVGEALLATLAEVAKDAWNHEVAQAWQDAYEAIRDLMLVGMVIEVPPIESASAVITAAVQSP
ncbi:MAG TPA: globin domain-containing protein [Labilithrix sp.]|nr:globin domain-containing protein [Labilithrix sp.]